MINSAQEENYVASTKAKGRHSSKPSKSPSLQSSLICSWTMLSYPLSHLARCQNKPSAVPLVSSLLLKPKVPPNLMGRGKKLIYFFGELDFPRNKVFHFPLDVFVHVFTPFF